MDICRSWLAGLVLACGLAACAGGAAQEQPSAALVLPRVSGENLEREAFTLPDDLPAPANLSIFAFERRHQEDVDTWFPVAEDLADLHGEAFAFFEFPTLPSWWPGMAKRFLDNAMRDGIPDPAQRARTITLYTEKKRVREALGIPNEKHIHVFLTDGDGRILWRAIGPITDESEAALRQAVTDTLAP